MEEKNLIPLVFEHEEFGKIRTLGDWENPLFCLPDICRVLDDLRVDGVVARLKGDPNTAGGISIQPIVDSLGRTQMVNFVDEPCLYRVIFSSRKPNAVKFQDWIFRVVIKSIRKTGSYTLPNDEIIEPFPKPAKKNLPPHLDDPNKLCVYVASLENGTVKIGRSSDFCRRANEIKQEYQLNIMGLYNTGYLPFRLAATIEKTCHRKLAFCRVKNEIFEISFADACEEVCKITVDVIEQDRALYGKNWPDANSEYTYFLSRIPVPPMAIPAFIIVESFASYKPAKIVDALPPGFSEQVKARALPEQIEIAAAIAETLSLQTKIEMLLKCAELSPSKKRKSYFLNKVDALI